MAKKTQVVAIVEVGQDYTDRLNAIEVDGCSLEQAQQIARDLGHQVIAEHCTIVHATDEIHIIVAVEPKEEERKMAQKLKDIFNLERIRNFTEKNIDQTEWIEEGDEVRRKILVVDTLVDGAHGAYIPGTVLELFGKAEGYDLEDPYNYEKNETIYDALEYLENEVNECLNKLLPSKGTYYVGFHEADGSYCLFYEEYEEREEE